MNDFRRFTDKVEIAKSGCWEWKAARDKHGYGKFGKYPDWKLAHRVSYGFFHKIPDGLCVLHKCDNRACVRPTHLYLGTKKDNTKDMITRGRSVHPKGEQLPFAKLKRIEVDEIRRLYSTGKVTQEILSKIFLTSQSNIQNILSGRTWN